jgi:GDPmannose 4,6-dehydratase
MNNNKTVLIIGGTGQLGFYLTNYLSKKKLKLYISTRNLHSSRVFFFKKNFKNKISFIKINVFKEKKIYNILKRIEPDYIFFLSGQSSVFRSFKKKKETLKSNFINCKIVLDAIIRSGIKVKFFNACSSEIFGNTKKKIQINSIKKPVSPYGQAKLKSFNLVKKYRKIYKLELYNGIIFNCESILRPKHFVIPKICLAAIAANDNEKKNSNQKIYFRFGNIDIKRDWGWCDEYIKKIWKLIHTHNYDFIIATGKTYSLKKLLSVAFSFFNLNWKNYVVSRKKFFRKREINSSAVNFTNLKKYLEIPPKIDGPKIILKMIKYYKKKH